MAISVSPLLFSLLGLPCRSSLLSAIFNSSCHFYCHAIFITVQPAIITAFHSRLDLELPFLLWCCRRHINFAAKDFVVTTGRCPVLFFFAFLVVVLLVTFTPSCVTVQPVAITYSSSFQACIGTLYAALFSVTVKIHEHAYQSFMVVYSIGNVRQWLQYISGCGKSTIKVGETTRKVRRTYG